jgi:hypothetical protein
MAQLRIDFQGRRKAETFPWARIRKVVGSGVSIDLLSDGCALTQKGQFKATSSCFLMRPFSSVSNGVGLVRAASGSSRPAYTSEAHRARQYSVTLAACPSPVRRFRPLPPVSSVTCAVPLLLP